jgi:hypothetical protein
MTTKNPHAVALARLGALKRTPKQAATSRANGKKGGRPRTRPVCRTCRVEGGLEPWNMLAPAVFRCGRCGRRTRDL